MVSAAIDSTTTTARGTITGSCRPVIVRETGFPSLSTVSCALEMEGVGLMATRKTSGAPSLIPPNVPPE